MVLKIRLLEEEPLPRLLNGHVLPAVLLLLLLRVWQDWSRRWRRRTTLWWKREKRDGKSFKFY